ncbi:TetR/AcrR family transcriptional regulator [Nocardioides sp. GXZ039]|uniref:TetR/AcrR family transcriptional regulator n=1 Tax=Nocardioides sp. GXZ039 TaxID=3136018 RepID=UPI0030F45825
MPRPAKFTDEEVLDAALSCVSDDGAGVTMADVAARLGGPVGSIYHRFASRDELLARLWIRTVRDFQAGLFALAETYEGDPERILVDSALHVPRYCREHPDRARALSLFRQPVLLASAPEGVRDDVASLNDGIDRLARRLTRAHYGSASAAHVELVLLATRIAPYGLVRPYVGAPVPPVIDQATRASAEAILSLEPSGRRRR